MKNLLLLLLLAFVFYSCLEKEVVSAALPAGTYTGTFSRSGPATNPVQANVTITINGNTFSGTSDIPRYPAIGTGGYSLQGQEITFVNDSFWTADFDWTFILKGTFTLQTTKGGITLTKQHGDLTDIYQLTRRVD